MKYMTFNSSCSYASVANMLEQYGVDVSDRSIALKMKLPYMFSYHDGRYLSGPMLQTAEWFNLYLKPIGYRLVEKQISSYEIADYLMQQKTAMLGIVLEGIGKHAVVYTGTESGKFVFLNNKWENDESPNELRLTRDELKQIIEPIVVVGTLQQISAENVDFLTKLKASVHVVQSNLKDITKLCDTQESPANLRLKLNTLFRPLFLDAITMLNMIDEMELANDFLFLQRELLSALRQDTKQSILLKEYISIPKLEVSVKKYIELIMNEIETQL